VAEGLPEGTVTVLFTDVVGSTDLTECRGDDAAQDLLRAHREVVRNQVREHDGHEVKGTGDGFMIAFASARRAVDCAIGIQRALEEHNSGREVGHQVPVRIGMNSGEVIREDADLFGSTVNAAARIAAKAGGGQILVSETVRALLGPAKEHRFVNRGRFRLKGFPERWRLFEAIWQEEAPAAVPFPLAERTPFVGRESERAQLRQVLDRAGQGCGCLVLIGGEPGVGKTRLAEEATLEARERGMLALSGRCYEMEGSPPYIPFVEMVESAARLLPPGALRAALGDAAPEVARMVPELRRLFPDLPPPLELPPEQERRFLFNSVREFIARSASAQPLLLVLDDAQWADDSTLLLLQHLAQRLSEMPVVVLATHRNIDLDQSHPLTRALEELLRQRLAQQVALDRLSESSVAAMMRALSGQEPPAALVDVVYAETEGNPFFVEEVFKHLAEEGRLFDAQGRWRTDLQVSEVDVPDSLRLVIGRRLERLTEDVRRALAAAAVVGRTFTFDVLKEVCALDADALLDAVDEAERAHLIVSLPDATHASFRFSHELIRQTLLSGVSAARLQVLHLQVAGVLESAHTHAQQDQAGDLAYHLRQAGAAADPHKTAHYSGLAGDRALSAAAFEDALYRYEVASSGHPADDRRGLADLLYKRGLALRSLGRWDEALAQWRDAVRVYQELRDTDTLGRIYGTITQQLLWAGRFDEGLELSLRGLATLGKRPGPDRCILLVGAGLALSLVGVHEPGEIMTSQAVTLAEEIDDDHLLGRMLFYRGFHHLNYLELRKQLVAATKSVHLLRASGDLWELANALGLKMFALYALGLMAEADRVGEELDELASRVGHFGALVIGRRIAAYREFGGNPDFERFEAFAEKDRELCTSGSIPVQSNADSYLGLARFYQGRWEEALHACRKARETESPGVFAGLDWSHLFLVQAYLGKRDTALRMLAETQILMPSAMTLKSRVSMATLLLRAARSSGLNARMLWGVFRRLRPRPVRQRLSRRGKFNTLGWHHELLATVEGLAVLGEREQAGKLYPLVSDGVAATEAVVWWYPDRLPETVAGIAAASGRRWQDAERHYQTALRQAHEFPVRIAQPEVRRWYARMLLDRDGPGDREKARELLTEAIAMYRRIGMPKHVEMAEALLGEV
jgi:class 3 adenylate cyclase/tetratricopeptide (TPR) repeat protein